MHLLDLPSELLLAVLGECHPISLAALNASCKAIHQLITGNRLLHKAVYLGTWDKPPPGVADTVDFDWESQVHNLIFLQKVLGSANTAPKTRHWVQCVDTILQLLRNSTGNTWISSRNTEFLSDLFNDKRNVKFFLCESSLFRPGPCENNGQLEHGQRSAKLHVLFGVPVEFCRRGRTNEPTDPHARARVYDLRNYTSKNFWGPFMDDGSARVDWEMMESIMIVLGYNLKKFHHKTRGRFPLWWNLPFDGAHPHSFADHPTRRTHKNSHNEEELSEEDREANAKQRELEARDPYGVTGIWMRLVCFLDYNDLFEYNFLARAPRLSDQQREPNTSDEAIRLISMRTHVSKIEPPSSNDGQALPVVHFEGVSESLHRSWDQNSNSALTGTVRLTPEGEVRWTSVSIFDGEERWKSEGIQVGGVGSARGVLGSWFDKDYDPEGPAGPTAFWKLSSDEFDQEPPLPPRIAASPSDARVSPFLADFREKDFDYADRLTDLVAISDEEDEEVDEEYDDEESEEEMSSPPRHLDPDEPSTIGVAAD